MEEGLTAEFGTFNGLLVESVFAPPASSFCCRNFAIALLGFCCKGGILGGVVLSSFTQLGLAVTPGEGLGKAGLESGRVELREGFWRGGLGLGLL